MAVEQSEYSANIVVFTWLTENVVANEAGIVEIWADNPDDETPIAFKKNSLNDGAGVLFFSEGHAGVCNVEVRGANDTVEEGELVVGGGQEPGTESE